MKNFFITCLVAVAAAAAAFAIVYLVNRDSALGRAARDGDAMTWLRTEFHLDEAHFAAIRKLHEDYSAVCERHCAAIMAARERSAPPQEMAALEKVCVDSMTEHFRRVAGLMPADQGRRYLDMVLPRVANYEHPGPPTVRVSP